MSKHEFDDWIVNKYESEEIPYNPQNWDKLAAKLNDQNKKDRKILPFWSFKSISIAASVAALLFCAFFLINKKEGKNTEPIVVEKENATPLLNNEDSENNNITQNNTEVNIEITEKATDNTTKKSITKHSTSTYKTTQNHSANIANSTNINSKNNSKSNFLLENTTQKEEFVREEYPLIPQSKHNDIDAQMRYAKDNNNAKKENSNTNYHTIKEPITHYAYNNPYNTPKPSASIGVGAGVNYGNMNTGYALGVSAKKQLGSNIYVDGTVNVAMNNNTPNVVAVNNINNVAARPSANQTHINSPAMANQSQQLYYVQFNPSLGYEIDELVSFSVGSDFQQLVNGEKGKESVIFNTKSGNSELVPKMDLGLTAKTEINLTNNINAGIIYREGINNLVNTSNVGINYLNRRYIQVMFKYNLNIR